MNNLFLDLTSSPKWPNYWSILWERPDGKIQEVGLYICHSNSSRKWGLFAQKDDKVYFMTSEPSYQYIKIDLAYFKNIHAGLHYR